MTHGCPTAARRAGVLLAGALLLAAGAGMSGCGWQNSAGGPSPALTATTILMQDQHGTGLGVKSLSGTSATVTLTRADAGNAPGLSAKYIAVRNLPENGKLGPAIKQTTNGTLSFLRPSIPAPFEATFMSTADLPESVMDCFAGRGFTHDVPLARLPPGTVLEGLAGTVVDGDPAILTAVVDDLNQALTDRRGVDLGRFSWVTDYREGIVRLGFGRSSEIGYCGWSWDYDYRCVLVNPLDPPATQARTVVRGMLGLECYGPTCPACSADDAITYLLEPGGSRLSKQGIAAVRFAAYLR